MVLTLDVYMSASTLAGDLDFVMYDYRLAGTSAIALFFVPAACCCLMVGFVCFLHPPSLSASLAFGHCHDSWFAALWSTLCLNAAVALAGVPAEAHCCCRLGSLNQKE